MPMDGTGWIRDIETPQGTITYGLLSSTVASTGCVWKRAALWKYSSLLFASQVNGESSSPFSFHPRVHIVKAQLFLGLIGLHPRHSLLGASVLA